MKRKILFIIPVIIFSLSCENKDSSPVVSESVQKSTASFQATEKDRIPAQERILINKIKKAIKNKNKKKLRSLYYLKNGNPEYIQIIPYVIDPLIKVDLSISTVKIVPDNKVAEFNMKFTVLYVGKVEVKTTHKKGGTSRTAIPVGIKDGKYYLTVGAK